MALYEITHNCGHQTETQIYGTNSHGERERTATRLAAQPCQSCTQAAHDQANTQAAQTAARVGLPTLTGSERQVAWAQTIRLQAVQGIAEYAERISTKASEQDQPTVEELIVDGLTRAAHLLVDARWWIDHRASVRGSLWGEMTDADHDAILPMISGR